MNEAPEQFSGRIGEQRVDFLEWVDVAYGRAVHDECVKVLQCTHGEQVEAEVLDRAFYQLYQDEIDDAVASGGAIFISDY